MFDISLERKAWIAIFGDEKHPGYDVIEHPEIFGGRASKKRTPDGNVYFDVPVGKDRKSVKIYRFLQQNPKRNSKWGDLARRGSRIMWLLDVGANVFLYRYSDIPGQGRVELKDEWIGQLIKEARQVSSITTVLK